MMQTCSKCSRPNPPEAIYCYFDGFVLEGHSRNGGPVAVGSQVFSSPFVFATGRTCRSFDELSLACQEEWSGAGEMLQQGFFENFFKGIGRVDLVMVAREAAKFPDRDRGLDQLLAKVPSDVLESPKLRLEPQEVNLGVLKIGEERAFDLRLENQGMRLLYGSVTCAEGVWLALGDPPGAAQKHFQFNHELTVPVHLRGDRLRAGNKTNEAKLLVESNGGTIAVTVRCDVPVKPFPEGVLKDAKSPRQVAEKAKTNPKEAAALFENGAVENWYKSNGWTYPVQGPAASGLGAVQQFFEALGLTPAPKVSISRKDLIFKAEPGKTLNETIEVKSEEKRPVYAHGTSNQPWLEVGRAKLNGRLATINVSIPAVPNKPGETLKARLTVQSNGNQRFIVPVTLEVEGKPFDFNGPGGPVDEVAPFEEVKPVDEVAPIDEVAPFETVPVGPNATLPSLPVVPAPPVAAAATTPAPSAVPPPTPVPAPAGARRSRKPQGLPLWVHASPAGMLALVLLGLALWDLKFPNQKSEPKSKDGEVSWTYDIIDSEPWLGIKMNHQMRFGILMLKERDQDGKFKRLTAYEDGETNNTCVWQDGSEFLFGKTNPGGFLRGKVKVPLGGKRQGFKNYWHTPDHVEVVQHVELVPGEQSRRLDTCLIHYTLENKDTIPHKVGLRVLLDTFIGTNDGVPFIIPGQSGLLTTMKDFPQKEIPDYIEALERPDLQNPGIVAHMDLKGIKLPGIELEPIERLLICRWPGNSEVRWELEDKQSMRVDPTKADSCVVVYWGRTNMNSGEKREMAFTYGLGKIAIEGADQRLGLSAGGSLRPGGEFTVTALVKSPKAGQKVKLTLPPDFTLAEGLADELVVESIPGQDYNQVSWRVKASGKSGEYNLVAQSDGAIANYKVLIKAKGIFD